MPRQMYHRTAQLLFWVILLFSVTELCVAENSLQKIEYFSPSKSKTIVRFYSESSPDFEVFERLSKKIFIIKFRNTKASSVPELMVFKDPLVSGLRLQKVGDTEYWVKIRTNHPELLFEIQRHEKDSNLLSILFYLKSAKKEETSGIEITSILRELRPNSEKLFVFSKKPLQHDIVKDLSKPGRIMKIRLFNAKMAKNLIIPGATTDILKHIKVEKKGKYINLVLAPQTYALQIKKRIKHDPIRLIFTISENKNVLTTDPDTELKEKNIKEDQKKAEKLKKDKFLTKLFNDAEKFYKIGRFEASSLKFKNIYNFAPMSEIGVRANFRSADALFQNQRQNRKRGGEKLVNQEYRSAINSALVADLGYEDIPRAYYNIGRNFLALKFYEDAYNQFEIIIQNYPESPYSKNALFHQGVIHLNMERHGKSIELLSRFVEENSDSPRIHAAYYKIGEAQFQLKKYVEAKSSFEKAWSLNATYMKRDAELMFHMGEAYFENRDYQTARALYEELIDLYPREVFSNLVAIRIGDFLRAEEKFDDAISAYKRAINNYPNELLLIGRMRIANVLAERPGKDDYKKAIDIYSDIVTKYVLSDQVEEATLRKALTLSLFHHYSDAILDLEAFCGEYPDNIYVKNNIIHDRILSTINAHIADYYYQAKYLDALGVFEQYEKKYYRRPEGSACFHAKKGESKKSISERLMKKAPLFLISNSNYRLRLYDKALQIGNIILEDKKDPLAVITLFNQGKIYDAKEQFEDAQRVYSRFINLYPEHIFTPLVKKALGDSYFKVHKPDRITRAIRIYLQTIRDYQDSENMLEREIVPSCWFALGNLYYGIGQNNDSIDAFKNVLNSYEHPLQNKNVEEYIIETHFILGNLYLELNQLPEALETYNNAIKLFPNSEKTPWAKYNKSQIFIKNNQKDKALAILEELVKAAKKSPDALWGPLAVENHKTMVNDLKFDKYLVRTPDAKKTD